MAGEIQTVYTQPVAANGFNWEKRMQTYTKTLTSTFHKPTHAKQKHMNVWMLIHAPGSVFFLLNLLELQQGFKNPGCVGQFSKHTHCAENQPAPVFSQHLCAFLSVCVCALKNYQEHHSTETQRWNRHTNQIRFPISSICTQITSCKYTRCSETNAACTRRREKKKS